MSDRIIPLSDAPAPRGESQAGNDEEPAQPQMPRDQQGFTPDPLNTLRLKPQIVEAISKVFDPEIPVNIYELGLIYDIAVDGESHVAIQMTLTAPACPSAQTIPLDVERRVREVEGVKDVSVAVVWDPPWTRDRMSEAAKLTLGMY